MSLSKNRFKFEDGVLPPEAFKYEHYMGMGLSKAEAKRTVQHMMQQKIFMSDTYQVNVQDVPVEKWGLSLTWLSIKRRDKEAFHDWRELQQIKNAICGPEREGVELYPAESRLADSANQYHLWVLPEDRMFPFGFWDRLVSGVSEHGAKQRPFEEE